MGQMVDGQWQRDGAIPLRQDGSFARSPTSFRNWIEPGGAFPPAPGRYLLYVSLACPWAHRALIIRRLKGLEGLIDVAVTHWLMGDEGWTFAPGPGVIADPFGTSFLHEVYRRADPLYSGRVTVPVLWDRVTGTIVNNESAEIIRMFNTAFDEIGALPGDFYPAALRDEIEAVNRRVFETVNNGVYKAGFATSQDAYAAAVMQLFETFDWLDDRLTAQPYLCGDEITEADWRLFTTLVRFDAVYYGHFKCNIKRLIEFPALWAFTRRLYHHPGIRATVDFGHIKQHYYASHRHINPSGIVPLGPIITWG